jgi:5-methylcytosine-specific restriction endonuclease McrA
MPDSPQRPECSHPKTEKRKKIQGNGVTVGKEQCLICGTAVRHLYKKSGVNVFSLPPWDEGVVKAWQKKWDVYRDARQTEWEAGRTAEQQAWRDRYQEYLQTPQWKEKRDKVLKRDNHTCQGCLVNRAYTVHHKTYDRVGREMPFDLESICFECHRIIHSRKD